MAAGLRNHSSAMATRSGAADSQAPSVHHTLQTLRMGLPPVSTSGAAAHVSGAYNYTSAG